MTKIRIWRFAFLQIVLLIFAAAAVGQAPMVAGEAVRVESFGPTSSSYIEALMDGFLADLSKRGKRTRGVIVNFGTVREIELRKRVIENWINFRGFGASLITFVRGGNVSEFRTDLWIVPAGAKLPRIEPEAFVAAEFGRVTRNRARAAIRKFFDELNKVPDHQGYIIIYGTQAQMNMQEKWILSDPHRQRRIHDQSRITIVRGGKRKNGIGTVMWLVPPGAANPTP